MVQTAEVQGMALSVSRFYWQQTRQYTIAGKTFRCSRRTYRHIQYTIGRLKEKHPTARMRIIQGAYNTTIRASAGTHDYDCTIDLEIIGLSWDRAQAFMRWTGWAAWHRTRAQGFTGDHIHAISLPPSGTNTPTLTNIVWQFRSRGLEVGAFVPGQVDDYYNHALGLKGQHNAGSDRSPFPKDIKATIFMPRGA